MVEAMIAPSWGASQGGGSSCDFNASLGSGVVTRMGKEKAIRGQAFDLATAKGELFDVDPIGLYTMQVGQAQFFDKAAGMMRNELTLVSDDFEGEPIGVWTDAGEHGTGTSQEYTRLVTWAHELAATEGEATLTFMSPGEKRADGKPEHRLFVWKKENNGEVKGIMYSLTGSAQAIDSFAQSLGFSKTSGPLESQRVIQEGRSGLNHSDIFQAYTLALSPKEKQEQAGYIERFRKEAQEVPDEIRWAKLRHRQEVFEKELLEHEGDIQEVLGLVVQGFAALPEVLERERSQYQNTSAPVDVVIQPQRDVVPPVFSLEGITQKGPEEKHREYERYEKKRDAIEKQTKNELILIQVRSKHSDEKVIGKEEKIASGLALSTFALLTALSSEENTSSPVVESSSSTIPFEPAISIGEIAREKFLPETISQRIIDFLDQLQVCEENSSLIQREESYDEVIHLLFTPYEQQDRVQREESSPSLKIPILLLETVQELFERSSLEHEKNSFQKPKEEVYFLLSEATQEIIGVSEEVIHLFHEEKINMLSPRETVDEKQGVAEEEETLQKLLAVAGGETIPQEVRDIALVLVYKQIQDIFLRRGGNIPVLLGEKIKTLFLQQKPVEKLMREVELKLTAFMGETGVIIREVVPLTSQEIFLGMIEGSQIIEDAPIPPDTGEKKLQIKKFIILSGLLRVFNERGNGEKPFHFNKKLFYKNPVYLDVAIITLLNVLDIPKELKHRLLLSLGIEVEQLKKKIAQLRQEYDFSQSEKEIVSFEGTQWLPLQYAFHPPKKKRQSLGKSSFGYTSFPSFMILFDYSRDVYQYLLQ